MSSGLPSSSVTRPVISIAFALALARSFAPCANSRGKNGPSVISAVGTSFTASTPWIAPAHDDLVVVDELVRLRRHMLRDAARARLRIADRVEDGVGFVKRLAGKEHLRDEARKPHPPHTEK